MLQRDSHHYMERAYQEALRAFDEGEVPVGAVVTGPSGAIIGRGRNAVERLSDATAHAEILAIGAAAQRMETWRLNGCTLYVTLEPCMMCLGALLASRVDRIVYATTDPRLGAVDTFPHRDQILASYRTFPVIESGVMQQECSELLKSFFRTLRANGKEPR
ncbi:MAG: tRNA-specific adenosine deaminase [Chitinivibrionales bacterium]|nr:tRNA-specific adenosine deaminase [Chitinivibrionales bacterium]